MTPSWVLLLFGVGLLVGYELWAAISKGRPTISQYIWRAQRRYPWLKYVVLASLGVLAWHFFGHSE